MISRTMMNVTVNSRYHFLLPYVVRKAFRTSLSVRCLIGFCGSLYQIKEMKFSWWFCYEGASLVAQRLKNLPAMQDTQVDPWVRKIPWRREWQSSILAWRIPCTEEPGRLQSLGSQRVGHDWVDEECWMLSNNF